MMWVEKGSVRAGRLLRWGGWGLGALLACLAAATLLDGWSAVRGGLLDVRVDGVESVVDLTSSSELQVVVKVGLTFASFLHALRLGDALGTSSCGVYDTDAMGVERRVGDVSLASVVVVPSRKWRSGGKAHKLTLAFGNSAWATTADGGRGGGSDLPRLANVRLGCDGDASPVAVLLFGVMPLPVPRHIVDATGLALLEFVAQQPNATRSLIGGSSANQVFSKTIFGYRPCYSVGCPAGNRTVDLRFIGSAANVSYLTFLRQGGLLFSRPFSYAFSSGLKCQQLNVTGRVVADTSGLTSLGPFTLRFPPLHFSVRRDQTGHDETGLLIKTPSFTLTNINPALLATEITFTIECVPETPGNECHLLDPVAPIVQTLLLGQNASFYAHLANPQSNNFISNYFGKNHMRVSSSTPAGNEQNTTRISFDINNVTLLRVLVAVGANSWQGQLVLGLNGHTYVDGNVTVGWSPLDAVAANPPIRSLLASSFSATGEQEQEEDGNFPLHTSARRAILEQWQGGDSLHTLQPLEYTTEIEQVTFFVSSKDTPRTRHPSISKGIVTTRYDDHNEERILQQRSVAPSPVPTFRPSAKPTAPHAPTWQPTAPTAVPSFWKYNETFVDTFSVWPSDPPSNAIEFRSVSNALVANGRAVSAIDDFRQNVFKYLLYTAKLVGHPRGPRMGLQIIVDNKNLPLATFKGILATFHTGMIVSYFKYGYGDYEMQVRTAYSNSTALGPQALTSILSCISVFKGDNFLNANSGRREITVCTNPYTNAVEVSFWWSVSGQPQTRSFPFSNLGSNFRPHRDFNRYSIKWRPFGVQFLVNNFVLMEETSDWTCSITDNPPECIAPKFKTWGALGMKIFMMPRVNASFTTNGAMDVASAGYTLPSSLSNFTIDPTVSSTCAVDSDCASFTAPVDRYICVVPKDCQPNPTPSNFYYCARCQCAPGNYGVTSAYCLPCAPGSYSGVPNAPTCTLCPPGKVSESVGATSISTCTSCAAGTFSSSGDSVCTTCPPGTASFSGASACSSYSSIAVQVSLRGTFRMDVRGRAVYAWSAPQDWALYIVEGLMRYGPGYLWSGARGVLNISSSYVSSQHSNFTKMPLSPFSGASTADLSLFKLQLLEQSRGVKLFNYGIYRMDDDDLLLYLLEGRLFKNLGAVPASTLVGVVKGKLGLSGYSTAVQRARDGYKGNFLFRLSDVYCFNPQSRGDKSKLFNVSADVAWDISRRSNGSLEFATLLQFRNLSRNNRLPSPGYPRGSNITSFSLQHSARWDAVWSPKPTFHFNWESVVSLASSFFYLSQKVLFYFGWVSPYSVNPTTPPTPVPSTVVPTQMSIPTVRPTPKPSFPPSEPPNTIAPTGAPTGQPSRQPSRQPTAQPSRQPSRQPTRQPTGQPTRQPSRQPSSQPTTAPTSLRASLFSDSIYTAFNRSFLSTPMHRLDDTYSFVSYAALLYKGWSPDSISVDTSAAVAGVWAPTQRVSRSAGYLYDFDDYCPSWIDFAHTALLLPSHQYFSKVTVLGSVKSYRTQLNGIESTSRANFTHSCTNSDFINQLVAALAQGNNFNGQCPGDNVWWRVRQRNDPIPTRRSFALCVNCTGTTSSVIISPDNATSKTACWGQSPPSAVHMNPCQRGICVSAQRSTAMTFGIALSVATVTKYPLFLRPPKVLASGRGPTSLSVSVNISAPGRVFCAPFQSVKASAYRPTSLAQLRNNFNSSSATGPDVNNKAMWEGVIVLSKLSPATNYTIFCYTEDLQGRSMPLAVALNSKVYASTTAGAAGRIVLTQYVPQLAAGDTDQTIVRDVKKFKFSIADATALYAVGGVSVTALLSPVRAQCPFSSVTSVTATAVAAPSTFSFSAPGAPASFRGEFLVDGPPGCYLLSISTARGSLFNLTSVSVRVDIFDVSSTLRPPAPFISSATMTPDALGVDVFFSTFTDIGAGLYGNTTWFRRDAPFNCNHFITLQRTGASAAALVATTRNPWTPPPDGTPFNFSCLWVSPRHLAMTLDPAYPTQNRVFTLLPALNDTLSLLPGTLRACNIGAAPESCRGNRANTPGSRYISWPLEVPLLVPSVSLSATAIVNVCKIGSTLQGDDIRIDPSATTGSGGRPWTLISWTVAPAGPGNGSVWQRLTAKALTAYLTKNASDTSKVVLVPGLRGGEVASSFGNFSSGTYNIALRVTNAFGFSDVGSVEVTIDETYSSIPSFSSPTVRPTTYSFERPSRPPSLTQISLAVPLVQLSAPPLVTMYAHEPLFLAVEANFSKCVPAHQIDYKWVVYVNASVQPLLMASNTAIDPRHFSLPPSTLAGESEYRVSVYAHDCVTGAFSTAGTIVRVQTFDGVLAVLAGAPVRTVSIGTDVLLDASGSFRVGARGSVTSSLGLRFSWSCSSLMRTSFGSACPFIYRVWVMPASQGARLVVPKAALSAMRSAMSAPGCLECVVSVRFSVSVSASSLVAPLATYVTDSASVTLRLAQTLDSTEVLLTTHPANWLLLPRPGSGALESSILTTVNPQNRIGLSAQVNTFSAGNASWAYEPATFPARAAPLSLLAVSAPHLLSSSLGLALPASYFTPARDYVFTVKMVNPKWRATAISASITIQINAPPARGIVSVSPEHGLSLLTPFLLQTFGWTDDAASLPLKFTFAYYLTAFSEGFVVVREAGPVGFCKAALLPYGSSPDYGVYVTALARDCFGAESKTLIDSKVSVLNSTMGSPGISAVDASNSLRLIQQLGDSAGVLAFAAGVGAVMTTQIDCALEATCASLNRLPCRTTRGTCGRCLPLFFGLEGDSNTKCFDQITSPGSIAQPQSDRTQPVAPRQNGVGCGGDNSTCLLGLCSGFSCKDPPKTCPSNCGSPTRGVCQFVDNKSRANLTAAQCTFLNPHCEASCLCFDKFRGRDCSVTADSWFEVRTVKNVACSALSSALFSSDVTTQTALVASAAVADLMLDTSSISEQAMSDCSLALAGLVNQNAALVASSTAAVIAVTRALDAILCATLADTVRVAVLQALGSLAVASQTQAMISENRPLARLSRLRLSVARVTLSDLPSANFTAPLTDSEIYNQLFSSLVHFTPSLETANYTSFGISVLEIRFLEHLAPLWSPPSASPSNAPTPRPSTKPTPVPTVRSTASPVYVPSSPTPEPTPQPTLTPSPAPTASPTAPSPVPTPRPSPRPSIAPSVWPTLAVPPTPVPTSNPTAPSAAPSATPTLTSPPTPSPTSSAGPSLLPSPSPSPVPSIAPSPAPSFSRGAPTPAPSPSPTAVPTIHAAIIVPDGTALGFILTGFSAVEPFPASLTFAYQSAATAPRETTTIGSASSNVLISTDDVAGGGQGDLGEVGWATVTLRNREPIYSYRQADRSPMQDTCPDKGVQRSLNCLGPDGKLATFTCPSPGSITYACGAHTYLPACLVYEAEQGGFAKAPRSQCRLLKFDAHTTTCKCRLQILAAAESNDGSMSPSQLLIVASAGVADYIPLHVTFVSSVNTFYPTPAPSRILRLQLVLAFRGIESSEVTDEMQSAIRQAVAAVLGLPLGAVSPPVIVQKVAPTPSPSSQPSVAPTPRPSTLPTRLPTIATPTGQPTSRPSPCSDDNVGGCTSAPTRPSTATVKQRRLGTTANGFDAQLMLTVPSVSPLAAVQQLAATVSANSTALLQAVQTRCASCSGLTLSVLAADLTPTSAPTPAPAPPSLPPVLPPGLPAPSADNTPAFGLLLGLGLGLPLLALLLYCHNRTRVRKLKVASLDYVSVAPSTTTSKSHRVAPALPSPNTEWARRKLSPSDKGQWGEGEEKAE